MTGPMEAMHRKLAMAVIEALETPVAVLLGGCSAEREISLKSGYAVVEGLEQSGVPVVAVDTAGDWIGALAGNDIRHAFIALHGVGGEDGTIQGALECLGVAYTGSGVLASALAMDKLRSKQLWQGVGLPTPAGVTLREGSDWQAVLDGLGGKVIVKPAHEGSSIGMTVADSADRLRDAWEIARQYDELVLAERWIDGPEYTVAIVGRKALPVIQLVTDHAFYDFDAKYVSDTTRYLCPCGVSADDEQLMQRLALAAFDSIGALGWGRVDVMVDPAGDMQLLEINTIPGMTDHSLVPMAAVARGVSFSELVVRILAESLGLRGDDGL